MESSAGMLPGTEKRYRVAGSTRQASGAVLRAARGCLVGLAASRVGRAGAPVAFTVYADEELAKAAGR